MSNLTNVFTDIADSIRSKTGGTDTYTPAEMADAVKYQCDHLVLSAEGFIENGVFGANVKLDGIFDHYSAPDQIGILYNKDGTVPVCIMMSAQYCHSLGLPSYTECVNYAINVLDFANSSDIIGTDENSIVVNRSLTDGDNIVYFRYDTNIYNSLSQAMWVRAYANFGNSYIYSEPLYIPHCILTTELTPTRNSSGTKPAVKALVTRIIHPTYTYTQAGLMYSRNNTISESATIAEANNIMVLENSDTPSTSNVVRKEANNLSTHDTNYGVTVVDAQKSETEGYGVWVRGYAVIDYNGTTKTVYNDAQYAKGLPV